MQVRCIYKTGGDYSVEYVKRLYEATSLFSTDFLCLTDSNEVDFCKTIPLIKVWPGWWSKIELFRSDLPEVPCVYFDLDTLIIKNIYDLLDTALIHDFIALRGFNERPRPKASQNFASGIMAGKFYLYSEVYDRFSKHPNKYMQINANNWRQGDQGFIADVIKLNNIPRLQDRLPKDYIIGRKYLEANNWEIPDHCSVVAWCGKPRLHELSNNHIISRHWRCQL